LPFAVLTLVGLPAVLAVLAFVVVYSFVFSGVGDYYFLRAPAAFGQFVVRFGSYAFVALATSAALFLLFQIVVVVLPQVRKIGFFGESVADYALARIATSIVPPNTGNVVVARCAHLHAKQRHAWRIGMPGLRHSAIYNDPDVIADTAEWIVNESMPKRATSVEQTLELSVASAE
jgi:hypothetical protein